MKIANIDREILKVTKKQGFTLSLKDTVFQNQHG